MFFGSGNLLADVAQEVGTRASSPSSGFGALTDSFGAAFQQPLTIVIFVLLIGLLLQAIVVSRRVRHNARGFKSAIINASELQSPLSGVADRLSDNTAPIIHELCQRWGFTAGPAPEARFSPASDVVTADRFLATEPSWRLVEITPGLATSIGILGTFLGISLGLGGIEFGNNTNNDAIFQSVGGVVDGLGTAFWTSIVGVLVSMFVNWRARGVETEVEKAVHEACIALDGWAPQVTPGDERRIMQQQLFAQVKQTATLELWLKRIAKSNRRLLEQEIRFGREMEEAHGTLKSLSDDLVSKMEEGFGAAVGPHMQKMTEAVEAVATAGIQSAQVFVDDMFGGLQSGLTEAIDRVAGSMLDFQGRFDILTSRLEQSAEKQLLVLERGEAVADRVRDRLSDVDKLMSNVQRFHEHMVVSEEQHSRLQAEVANSTSALTAGVSAAQGALAGQMETVQAVMGAIVGELTQVQGMAGEFRSSLADATGNLHTTTLLLNKRISDETALVDRYAEATSALSHALVTSGPLLKGLPDVTQLLSRTTEIQRDLATRLAGVPDKVNALLVVLEERFSGVSNAADDMRLAAEATEEWAEHATGAIRNFQGGVQEVLGSVLAQFDAELQKAVRALGAAMNELEDLVEAGTNAIGEPGRQR